MKVTIRCTVPKVEDVETVLKKIEGIEENYYLDNCELQIEVYDPDKHWMGLTADD